MTYSKRDIITSISLMIFIITFIICLVLFCKWFYYYDASNLSLDKLTGLSMKTIKKNYDILIRYQSIFYQGKLSFPNFKMSTTGRIHFEQVKVVFEVIQGLMVISGISSFILVRKQHKEHKFMYLKLTAIITVVVPIVIGSLAAIDFDRAFTLFHQIVFQNNYWIFNSYSDPIINILPETFFMNSFIRIIILVIGSSLGLYLYYLRCLKNIKLEEKE